jgi:hypothetical protein
MPLQVKGSRTEGGYGCLATAQIRSVQNHFCDYAKAGGFWWKLARLQSQWFLARGPLLLGGPPEASGTLLAV